MSKELISANIESDVLIKEIDKGCIHVRLERITVTPGREKYPSTTTQIKCFTIETFEKLEALRYAKSPTTWYKNGGWETIKIVHDGRLEEKPEVKAIDRLTPDEMRKDRDDVRRVIRKATKKPANNA